MAANTCLLSNVLIILVTLVFFSNLHTSLAISSPTPTTSVKIYQTYIKKACNSTTYPSVCYKFLSIYATTIRTNPLRLATLSVSLSLKAARNASVTISKMSKQKGLTRSEAAVIKDCVENIYEAIDELKDSLTTIGHLDGSDIAYQMENIKTWVSAALTNENTCMDELDELKVRTAVKKNIRSSILGVATMTSNALSLINRLQYF
ncbi:21 kDa protein-like [Quillaja saponaria]|uniref:21 kDa protein-like n=1 Tax=Quillaja saponaria TaxID=32244 RepID=A0AAD7QJ88_QUISA|nr:21 kDa protein-like [Quillaja saponaria]